MWQNTICSSSNTGIVKFNTESGHDTNTEYFDIISGGRIVSHEMFVCQKRLISSLPTTKNILKMKAAFFVLHPF